MAQSSGSVLSPSLAQGISFDSTFAADQMKKTLPAYRSRDSPRCHERSGMPPVTPATGNKPAVLEVGNSAGRGDPDSPAIVLEKGE